MAKQDFCGGCPVGGTINDEDQTCSAPDPNDGLPVVCVGPWAEEKHARVRKYVDISRAARRKFLTGSGGATFVDLFSGPGRARIRGALQIVDGSPLVAAREALHKNTPFTEVHIADANELFVSSTMKRLTRLGVCAKSYVGRAEETVHHVASSLNGKWLHLAFLDPYDLKSLPFGIIRRLAQFDRIDMVIHVSVQDLQRNLRRYIDSEPSPLDSFVPGWRQSIDAMRSDVTVRRQILERWLELIRGENMEPAQGVEKVTGTNNQPLYWLIFVARHRLAMKFWEDIRNVSPQQSLDF